MTARARSTAWVRLGGPFRLPQDQVHPPQAAQDQRLIATVDQGPGEIEGPGQLGEGRRGLTGREAHLTQEAAGEHLSPAVGRRARDVGSLPARSQRSSDLAEPEVGIADRGRGPGLVGLVADLVLDRQGLLQIDERALKVAEPVIRGTDVVQESGFPQPVAGRADDRERRGVGLEGFVELAEAVVQDSQVVEGPGLTPPVAQGALLLEDPAVALERGVGLSQAHGDRREVLEHVRLHPTLLSRLVEERQRLLVEAQGLAQLSLRVQGVAEIVERLALFIRTAQAALQSQVGALGRHGAREIAHGRLGEPYASPGGGLPSLVRQLGEQRQRLLAALQCRFWLAKGSVDGTR